MSIKVEEKRGKTTVETDYRDSFGADHFGVYESPELLGAMRTWGIEKIEVNGITDRTDVKGALRDEFDRQYEKGHGRKYFGL